MKENPTESLSKGYNLNDKGFLLYKDRMYVLTWLKLSC